MTLDLDENGGEGHDPQVKFKEMQEFKEMQGHYMEALSSLLGVGSTYKILSEAGKGLLRKMLTMLSW